MVAESDPRNADAIEPAPAGPQKHRPVIDPRHRFLFDDLGELTPIPRRRRLRPVLTPEQKLRRKIDRERYRKRLGFLFGPQKRRRRRSREIFALFPDTNDFPVSESLHDLLGQGDEEIGEIIDAEQTRLAPDVIELGQLIIRERCAMVRECWNANRLRKRNNYYVGPMIYSPVRDSDLRGSRSEAAE